MTIMNDFGFVLKTPTKKVKTKADPGTTPVKKVKTKADPGTTAVKKVTKIARAVEVYRANEALPLKEIQSKIASELAIDFNRAYGYVRAIVNQKLASPNEAAEAQVA